MSSFSLARWCQKEKKTVFFHLTHTQKKQQPQKDMTQYKWHPVFIGYLVFFFFLAAFFFLLMTYIFFCGFFLRLFFYFSFFSSSFHSQLPSYLTLRCQIDLCGPQKQHIRFSWELSSELFFTSFYKSHSFLYLSLFFFYRLVITFFFFFERAFVEKEKKWSPYWLRLSLHVFFFTGSRLCTLLFRLVYFASCQGKKKKRGNPRGVVCAALPQQRPFFMCCCFCSWEKKMRSKLSRWKAVELPF